MATIVAAVAARVAGAAVRSYGRRGGVRLAAVACTRAGARSGVHSRAALAGARSIAGTSAAGAPTAAAPPPVVAVDTSVAEGRVWVVSIERPAVRNAVDRRTADALTAVFTAFDADATACVAVLAGSGGTFCAGADLKAFSDDVAAANRLEPVGAGDGPMGPSRMLLTKPVIAAIDGYAVAGGLELALWADLRVADDTAVLGVHCRRWGVPLIDGGTVRLPRLIGRSRALDLILTGREVTAAEALSMGLVNRVVPPGQARAAAIALAASLAALPQECMRNDRLAVYAGEHLPLMDALAAEFALGEKSLAAGARDGARRFARGAGRHGAPASAAADVEGEVAAPPQHAAAPKPTHAAASEPPHAAAPTTIGGGMNATSMVSLSLAASPFGPGAAGGMTRKLK